MNKIRTEVIDFIYSQIEKHPKDIALVVADKFKFSRQRAYSYISREIENGKIIKVGKNRGVSYFSVDNGLIEFKTDIEPSTVEDMIRRGTNRVV